MKSIILFATIFMTMGVAGSASGQNAYPQNLQDSFMNTCVNLQDFNKLQQPGKVDINGYCKCILENSQKQMSVSDYEKNKTGDIKDFPMMPSLEKIASECSDKYLKK